MGSAIALPRLTRQAGDQPGHHDLSRRKRIELTRSRGDKRASVGKELGILQFPGKVGLELSTRDSRTHVVHVPKEAVHDLLGIRFGAPSQCDSQVKQITPCLSLVEGAELGAEQLLKLVGEDVCLASEPGILHDQRFPREAQHREVLSGVDFNLETKRRDWGDL